MNFFAGPALSWECNPSSARKPGRQGRIGEWDNVDRHIGKWRRLAMRRTQRHHRPATGAVTREGESGAKAPLEPLVIAARETHSGNIEFEGTVKIDGVVGGNIRANRIVVGPAASIAGTLTARSVHVDGVVSGMIDGGRVSVGPTARIVGDVTYDALSIANGASISGRCQDRAESKIAFIAKPPRSDEPALPFNAARAAYRKSTSRLRPPTIAPQRMTAPVVSMREIWESYQRDRMLP